MIEFSVDGIPKPQPRVRACVRGKHAGVYDPGSANDWKLRVADAAMKVRPNAPITGAVELSVVVWLPRPAGHYGKRGLKPSAQAYPIGSRSGDWDNYGKAICDALTDIGMWSDDCIVASAEVSKRWATARPGAVVYINSLNGEMTYNARWAKRERSIPE